MVGRMPNLYFTVIQKLQFSNYLNLRYLGATERLNVKALKKKKKLILICLEELIEAPLEATKAIMFILVVIFSRLCSSKHTSPPWHMHVPWITIALPMQSGMCMKAAVGVQTVFHRYQIINQCYHNLQGSVVGHTGYLLCHSHKLRKKCNVRSETWNKFLQTPSENEAIAWLLSIIGISTERSSQTELSGTNNCSIFKISSYRKW